MFFQSMHEHLVLEEILWAALSGLGQASSVWRGLQYRSQGASTGEPQSCGHVSVLADCSLMRTLPAGSFCEAPPALKPEVVVQPKYLQSL